MTRQRRGKQAAQTPSAPRPILIKRLESQRIERDLVHGYSPSIAAGKVPRRAATVTLGAIGKGMLRQINLVLVAAPNLEGGLLNRPGKRERERPG